MVNSHFIKFLLGKQLFLKSFSNNSYDRLRFHIFGWLGLNPDYALVIICLMQNRALPDITMSGPEFQQIFKIQTVRKLDVFLPGCY